ncbi:sensor histidine kinase [Desulfofundulus thermosubterraneus]|uniref:histidine kinase n=1 Tax=Desulfofundulus thermosubterraneus DSM 16057 TaxID=1121432 RepID=A0A1M6BZD9_9FIRM|nr:HAMP domain-containing sensor histidine kinase [Desulfofundulus thermosubterraneus]SHI54102.1 two-component system, OmpR family, sensor histidine kinase CssS [Desulfofundulus thermosubterraneus DSM 16057]
MRKISLTVKMWLALSLVSLLVYVIVMLIMPFLVRNFFTLNMIGSQAPPEKPPEKNARGEAPPYGPPSGPAVLGRPDFRIRDFIVLADGTTIPEKAGQMFSSSFIREILQNAGAQQTSTHLYEYNRGQENIRYVIRKEQAYGRPLYRVTLIRKSEEDRFIKSLLLNFVLFTGIALMISWFASLFIARYLTRPLIQMERHVKRIANRNWHEPLEVRRNDEIGRLARSIEVMRRQLVRQDEMQQSMLQNISHELKTPVMVIRSYAQAIQDGVYPKGDLAGSIQVIDEEGARLEKLVKQLLYLTRLDYLATREQVQKEVKLDRLVENVVQRLCPQRPEISCQLDLQPVSISGDEEVLRVMIENLLENHLRYAVSRLEISLGLSDEKTAMVLSFWNDGSRIEPHILDQLFQPFHKGREGKFGLGLTIVQRIVKMHRGEIKLENERDGVSSTVKIPFRGID